MKSLKRILTLVLSLALVAGFTAVPVKAHAAEATTYYVTYDKGAAGWYVSTDKVYWSAVDISGMKSGDNLVIDADGQDVAQLVLTAYVDLGEVAFCNKANAVVNAPSANHVYAVGGATGVFNGNVNRADAYYTGVLQINGNVGTFVGNYDPDGRALTMFGVSGTVDKANVKWNKNLLNNNDTLYSIAKGKLVTNASGYVDLKEGEYSLTPTESTTSSSSGSTSGKTLDDVPATGSTNSYESFIFFGLAAVFAICGVVVKKKAR